MRSTLALIAAVSLSPPPAAAQDTMAYYTFQGRDAVVTCGHGRSGARVVRTIFKQGSGWFERDLSPTDSTWASSGCAGYIAEQSRIISPEESRERLNAILNPPPPRSSEEIMRSIKETVCSAHPEHRDCADR